MMQEYFCGNCRFEGCVDISDDPDVLTGLQRISDHHAANSPDCTTGTRMIRVRNTASDEQWRALIQKQPEAMTDGELEIIRRAAQEVIERGNENTYAQAVAEAMRERLPILHLTPAWNRFIHVDPRCEPMCFVEPKEDDAGTVLELKLRADIAGEQSFVAIPVKPVQREEFEQKLDGSMHRFGMLKVGPGTWKVVPSVNIPGVIHAFVVLCQVPEPAPWEK